MRVCNTSSANSGTLSQILSFIFAPTQRWLESPARMWRVIGEDTSNGQQVRDWNITKKCWEHQCWPLLGQRWLGSFHLMIVFCRLQMGEHTTHPIKVDPKAQDIPTTQVQTFQVCSKFRPARCRGSRSCKPPAQHSNYAESGRSTWKMQADPQQAVEQCGDMIWWVPCRWCDRRDEHGERGQCAQLLVISCAF